jgi:uncharacterized damage-inducible protein DinB
MNGLEQIRALCAYNQWANGHVLDAAARLDAEDFARDLGASFGSVRGNLAHIAGAQDLWLSRWTNAAPAAISSEESMETLRRELEQSDVAVRAFVDALTEEELGRQLSYTDTKGNRRQAILWQTLLHVANHGTHHRAEAALLLTALGQPPRQLDFVFFELERAGAPPRLT